MTVRASHTDDKGVVNVAISKVEDAQAGFTVRRYTSGTGAALADHFAEITYLGATPPTPGLGLTLEARNNVGPSYLDVMVPQPPAPAQDEETDSA